MVDEVSRRRQDVGSESNRVQVVHFVEGDETEEVAADEDCETGE